MDQYLILLCKRFWYGVRDHGHWTSCQRAVHRLSGTLIEVGFAVPDPIPSDYHVSPGIHAFRLDPPAFPDTLNLSGFRALTYSRSTAKGARLPVVDGAITTGALRQPMVQGGFCAKAKGRDGAVTPFEMMRMAVARAPEEVNHG